MVVIIVTPGMNGKIMGDMSFYILKMAKWSKCLSEIVSDLINFITAINYSVYNKFHYTLIKYNDNVT